MMKRFIQIFSIVLLFACVISLCACEPNVDPSNGGNQGGETFEEQDYVSQLKLNMDSNTKKVAVTVKTFVDGDTTHFNVPDGITDDNVLKARYLAINTPESTGQIEPWGKAASNFTKSKLKSAQSIILESDDDKWNLDSTGGRYLVWVWYRTSEDSDYRNLNIEILQNGLALASNTARNKYGEIGVKALDQAKKLKLKVYSGEQDPDFYYGDAQVLTLKEIRTNIQKYEATTVAFDAVVTKNYNDALYVEYFDEETQLYYGIYVYLGYSLSGQGLEIVSVGNLVRFVGSLQYYETGGTYQIANLKYQAMRPNDPTNIKLIESGHTGAFVETDPDTFVNGKVTIEMIEILEDETEQKTTKEFDYAYLALNTSIEMKNLEVKSIYTTTNDSSSSKGAMTLTCVVNGITVKVRTVVLYDDDNNVVTADAYEGKTIDVKGFVDYFDGEYQIKVFSTKDITIH